MDSTATKIALLAAEIKDVAHEIDKLAYKLNKKLTSKKCTVAEARLLTHDIHNQVDLLDVKAAELNVLVYDRC